METDLDGRKDGSDTQSNEGCAELSRRVSDIIAGKLSFDNETEEVMWKTLKLFEDRTYYTSKNLEYRYKIRGNEMFVSRKEKSITRSTVVLAFKKALEIQQGGEIVKGPKKLGTFGASYLYPIFQTLNIL